jgi:CDGSH-type Zn-finger protein
MITCIRNEERKNVVNRKRNTEQMGVTSIVSDLEFNSLCRCGISTESGQLHKH